MTIRPFNDDQIDSRRPFSEKNELNSIQNESKSSSSKQHISKCEEGCSSTAISPESTTIHLSNDDQINPRRPFLEKNELDNIQNESKISSSRKRISKSEETEVQGSSSTQLDLRVVPLSNETSVADTGRERLKRHRVEVAGKVWIPETWGQEELLKDWIDCTAFDASLVNNSIISARAALVQEGRRANSGNLRIENRLNF